MQPKDYAEVFHLNDAERHLRVLVCAKKEAQPSLPHAEFIDPTTLQDLPLPLEDHKFDLVLCPNVIFGENATNTSDFYQRLLTELIRVGSEVRVYPLVSETAEHSKDLTPLIHTLFGQGMGIEVRATKNHGHPNAMLVVRGDSCAVKPKMKVR